jgi:hypothetical protein
MKLLPSFASDRLVTFTTATLSVACKVIVQSNGLPKQPREMATLRMIKAIQGMPLRVNKSAMMVRFRADLRHSSGNIHMSFKDVQCAFPNYYRFRDPLRAALWQSAEIDIPALTHCCSHFMLPHQQANAEIFRTKLHRAGLLTADHHAQHTFDNNWHTLILAADPGHSPVVKNQSKNNLKNGRALSLLYAVLR